MSVLYVCVPGEEGVWVCVSLCLYVCVGMPTLSGQTNIVELQCWRFP